MANLVVKNGVIVTPKETRCTNLWIKEGLVGKIGENPPDSTYSDCLEIDARGCYVTPGLIDLQVNGSSDCNLWEITNNESLTRLRAKMASSGVTTFLPTLITDDIDNMVKSQAQLTKFGVGEASQWSVNCPSARMPGLHLEGPFLSPARPGVHPANFIVKPTLELLEKLVGKTVLMMTLACEQDKSPDILNWLKSRGVYLSIGHSNATYEEANLAFSQGVAMVTHIFNAMTGIHHRSPGLAGAALMNDEVDCCLIPDGLHLSREIVEMVVRLKGKNKTILVTDIAHVGTNSGGLVGSSITLDQGVKNMVNWGICEFASAIQMASSNPACAIGVDSKVGEIKEGLLADLVLWDKKTLDVLKVMVGGKVFDLAT